MRDCESECKQYIIDGLFSTFICVKNRLTLFETIRNNEKSSGIAILQTSVFQQRLVNIYTLNYQVQGDFRLLADGLILHDLLAEVGVEPEEVDHFCRGVDFGLK